MAFTTYRSWYKYGRETDEVELTVLEHETFEKALAYCYRYNKGLRFVSVSIETEDGEVLYELFANGDVFDYREKEIVSLKDETEKTITVETKDKVIEIKKLDIDSTIKHSDGMIKFTCIKNGDFTFKPGIKGYKKLKFVIENLFKNTG